MDNKKLNYAKKMAIFNESFNLESNQEWFHNLTLYFKKTTEFNLTDFYKYLHTYSDYIKIRQEFIIFILEDTKQYYNLKKFKAVNSSVDCIINLWRTDPTGSDLKKWSAAKDSAKEASGTAKSGPAWSAAWSAAKSATWSDIKNAADNAAESAAWSAAECIDGDDAWKSALRGANKKYADKLLQILKEQV